MTRPNFMSSWAIMFSEGNFARLFHPLKQHLNRLLSNKRINCSKIFLTILNSFLILFKNFQWILFEEKDSILIFATISDIFCIINYMLQQMIELHEWYDFLFFNTKVINNKNKYSTESELLLVISKWLKLVVEFSIGIFSLSSIINCFYALSLQTIDVLMEHRLKFSQVWKFITELESENLLKQNFSNLDVNDNKNFKIALSVLNYIRKYSQSLTMLDSDDGKMEELLSELKLESLDFSAVDMVISFYYK